MIRWAAINGMIRRLTRGSAAGQGAWALEGLKARPFSDTLWGVAHVGSAQPSVTRKGTPMWCDLKA